MTNCWEHTCIMKQLLLIYKHYVTGLYSLILTNVERKASNKQNTKG